MPHRTKNDRRGNNITKYTTTFTCLIQSTTAATVSSTTLAARIILINLSIALYYQDHECSTRDLEVHPWSNYYGITVTTDLYDSTIAVGSR